MIKGLVKMNILLQSLT